VSPSEKTPKKTIADKRRARRKIKAAVSIGLALAAGTFLACQRGVDSVQRAIDAARSDDALDDAQADLSRSGAAPPTPPSLAPSASQPDARTTPTTALTTSTSPKAKDASVDVHEHRKGMPVRDNLLE
jgi:hypothetical protein